MSTGTYIWQGLKPCIKMLLTIGCGFGLTKKGLFPPAASKGLSQISMNVGLPCLLFASMVPSFNSDNIRNFGPLCMMALLNMFIGLSITLLIREIFYVPANFRWGILMLGTFSNWGNLPTAIVQSVATEEPFDPTTDPKLGIAYIAIFILVMNVTFYGTGVYRICGWDFRDNLEPTPRTFALRLQKRRRQLDLCAQWISQRRHPKEVAQQKESEKSDADEEGGESRDVVGTTTTPRATTLAPAFSRMTRMESSHADIESLTYEQQAAVAPLPLQPESQPTSPPPSLLHSMFYPFRGFLTPITMGVILSLPFALVDPLKALVVKTEGWTGTKIPNAPDGSPPLSFFYDFAVFVGAITIPGGLIILGASFARIKISRESLKEMPIGAICAMTFIKLLFMPVVGILMVSGIRDNTSLFPRDEKMLSFVAFLLMGTPSAVNQMVATSLFVKEGQNLDILATFLLVQYALLLLQSAALTAISLWLVSK